MDKTSKICRSCKEDKDFSHFYNHSASKDRMSYVCKICSKEESRKWAEENPNKTREGDRARYYRSRDKRLGLVKDRYEKKKDEINAKRKIHRDNNKEHYRLKSAENYKKYKPLYQERQKKDRVKNEYKRKNSRYKSAYGITYDFYLKRCKELQNRCEICSEECKLVVDHNHTTKKFRGLLCGKCNTGIGQLKENIESLKKAIQYISERNINESFSDGQK